MKKEHIKGFIEILQQITGVSTFDTGKLLPMLEQMELMGSLMYAFNMTENEEELVHLGEKMKRCEAESKKVAKEFFSEYGMDFKDIQERFRDPNILGEKEKDYLLHTKEKLAEIQDKLKEPEMHIVSKKKKGNKGRARV